MVGWEYIFPRVQRNNRSNIFNNFQSINISDLSFSYEGESKVFLCPKLSLYSQNLYGLSAPSGYGKSTFLNLLSTYSRPGSGQILIDNSFDINKPEYIFGWRCSNVLAESNPYFFDDTIENNIALSSKVNGIDYDLMEYACHIACIDDHISRLKNGFNTRLLDSGKEFSTGQRQRIALARALYLKPSLLFLDEATSGVDFQTNRLIFERLLKSTIRPSIIILVTHDADLLSLCSGVVSISADGLISLRNK